MLSRTLRAASVVAAASVLSFVNFASARTPLVTGEVTSTYQIGEPSLPAPAVTAGSIYSNVTNFTGFGVTNGGFTGTPAAGTYSGLLLDDLNVTGGGLIGQFKFSVANLNATAQNVSPAVRIYADNGANGPGTLLAAFNFNPLALPASNVSVVTFAIPVASQFTVPAGKLWAGVAILADGVETSAILNNEGQGTFNPPNVGTSADLDSGVAAALAPYLTNGPAATNRTSPFAGNPVASYGWELTPVPEPGSMLLAGLGLVGLVRRRRA